MNREQQNQLPGINNRPRNSRYVFTYSVLLILFGTLSSLALQWGKNTKVRGSHGKNGAGDEKDGRPKPHYFDHDFFMAPALFLPQLICLIIFLIVRNFACGRRCFPQEIQPVPRNPLRAQKMKYNKAIFILPALFNYVATCLIYVGVRLTYHSSTILFKGTILFFTSLLSVAFLGRNMNPRMWTGVVIGILGLAVLGLNDYIKRASVEYDTNGIVAGDLLIVMAQIMYATQAVYEQKILNKYTNLSPFECLGYEGLWGLIISFVMAIIFSFVNAGAFSDLPGHYLENPSDAFKQMKNSAIILFVILGSMLFNTLHYWIALIITKNYGATPRIVIESLAYAIAWGVALGVGWQKFDVYIIPGFFLVVLGYILYFDLLIYPVWRYIYVRTCGSRNNEELATPLIQEDQNGNGGLGPGIQ